MIRLHNINKSYRTERVETLALENINLDVAPGEFVSIMGPSGCGKSTLLNLIGLLDRPTSGALARSNSAHAFVVRGNEAVRVPVQFGMSGKETIEIRDGLREGDQVVISDISEYDDVQQVRLKGRQQ